MAKKNSFGKLIAFTTAVAAIGGACYIFRDQIKETEIYKKTMEKLSGLRDKVSDKFASEEDDFFFDDDFDDEFEDDVFSDNAKNSREYTSITINAKDECSENEEMDDTTANVVEDVTKTAEDTTEKVVDIAENATDAVKDVVQDVSNATEDSSEEISDTAKEVADDIANAVKSKTEDMKEIFADVAIPTITFGNNNTDKKDETTATAEVLGYENEGLSDVDEDPDVLSDMDKLDF